MEGSEMAVKTPARKTAAPKLPRPLLDDWAWQDHAACKDVNPELFFSPETERGLRKFSREMLAKSLCSTCPVRNECRTHAAALGEVYGVWGGTSARDRAAGM
jgi:WhiB family redox-sensing transcriptional regulator